MLFALACREAGITNEKLHEINFNIEWAVDAVRKEVETVVRKNLDDIVNRIAEQTEPQTDYKKWETKPTADMPTENTTCVGVAMALVEDEPQTEHGFSAKAMRSTKLFEAEPQTEMPELNNIGEAFKDFCDKTDIGWK